MTGIKQFNFPAFFKYADQLRSEGHEVLSPAEEDIARAGNEFWQHSDGTHTNLPPTINYRDCLRVDLNWIIDKAEAIALIPGWEKSSGAAVEWALAKALGLKFIYLT
jgi:hypothetical protein